MKIVIWGMGIRGKRIYEIIPKNNVLAFIDNKQQSLKEFDGIPVITFQEYIKGFKGINILISVLEAQEIVKELESSEIYNYWIASQEPTDMYNLNSRTIIELFNEIYSENKKYLVYGYNYYSFLLYDYLLDKGFDVRMYIRDRKEYIKYEIYNAYQTAVIEDFCCNNSDYDEILVCSNEFEHVRNRYDKKNIVTNAMENIKKTKKYYDKSLKIYNNIHCDKKCFVIGNGPSLKMDDLDRLYNHNEVTFGTNRIFVTNQLTRWRPTYYVAVDSYLVETEGEIINSYEAETKFIADLEENYWNMRSSNGSEKIHYISDTKSDEILVSDDLCFGVYAGMTVLHTCLQIAIYMGIKEIYLLGADTTRYTDTEKSHFIAGYHTEQDKITRKPVLDVDRIISGYESIKKFAEEKNVKIYNATRGGNLEVFKRIEFDTLFNEINYK